MFALLLVALVLALSPVSSDATALNTLAATRPRTCPSCGEYRGPNLGRIYGPYLRQVDIWPEFDEASCQFEVPGFTLVTLSRTACASERDYRAGMPRGWSAG